MHLRRIAILAAILTVTSSAVFANPIHYQEAVSGDSATFPGPLLALDFGTNTIEGTAGWAASTDFDYFRFIVPTGGTLTSLTYSFATTGTTTVATTGWRLSDYNPPEVVLGHQNVNVTGTGSVAFLPGLLPLPADTYVLVLESLGRNGGTFSTNYTWTLNVDGASVPDSTSTLALLAVGLVALALGAKSVL